MRSNTLSRKPKHVPIDKRDDRLVARNRLLILAKKFDPSIFDNDFLLESYAGFYLFILDTSRYLNDLISNSYTSSPIILDMVVDLLDSTRR